MEREKLGEAVELAAAVYRLTQNLPADEILKRKIREVGLGLIEDFIFNRQNVIINKIRLLGALFILGQKQNWLNGSDCMAVFERYKKWALDIKNRQISAKKDDIVEGEKKQEESEKTFAPKKTRIRNEWVSLKQRQAIIVGVLREKNNGIGFKDLVDILKNKNIDDISSRTIRNELKRLIEKDIIKQNGWAKNSVYKLI